MSFTLYIRICSLRMWCVRWYLCLLWFFTFLCVDLLWIFLPFILSFLSYFTRFIQMFSFSSFYNTRVDFLTPCWPFISSCDIYNISFLSSSFLRVWKCPQVVSFFHSDLGISLQLLVACWLLDFGWLSFRSLFNACACEKWLMTLKVSLCCMSEYNYRLISDYHSFLNIWSNCLFGVAGTSTNEW